MTLDYFYGQTGELFSFYRIPKALFQEQRFQSLSTDAKTLYGILLDRMSLSAKNGWLDEQNRVFIIFTIEDSCNRFCIHTIGFSFAKTEALSIQVGMQGIHDIDGQIIVKKKPKDVVAIMSGSLKPYFYFV